MDTIINITGMLQQGLQTMWRPPAALHAHRHARAIDSLQPWQPGSSKDVVPAGPALEAAIWSHSHSSSEGLDRVGGTDLSEDQTQDVRACTSTLAMIAVCSHTVHFTRLTVLCWWHHVASLQHPHTAVPTMRSGQTFVQRTGQFHM